MKHRILTLSKTQFEERDGKLYHKVLKVEEFEDEQLLYAWEIRAQELRNQGKTYREIADVLNSEGFRTVQKKLFHPGSLLNRKWYRKQKPL